MCRQSIVLRENWRNADMRDRCQRAFSPSENIVQRVLRAEWPMPDNVLRRLGRRKLSSGQLEV